MKNSSSCSGDQLNQKQILQIRKTLSWLKHIFGEKKWQTPLFTVLYA